MLSAPSTPHRPSCRTRRRSSSFSTFSAHSHSPDRTTSLSQRRGSRPQEKRAKRAPSDSPLKHSQPLFNAANDEQSILFWTQPSPFAPQPFPFPSTSSSSSTAPVPPHSATSVAPPSTAASLFSASATDFSLPSAAQRWQQRGRHPSTESTWSSSLSSSPRALVSFEDSSFSSTASAYYSDSSPSHSLHSVSPTPFTFSCLASTSHGPPPTPPVLRRVSSCHSPMVCDGGDLTPVETLAAVDAEEDEAARLHRVAFEQLRSATRADQESFVERMRRWEAERAVPAEAGMHEEETDDEGASSAGSDEEEEDEEDEVEVTLDLGPQSDSRSPPAVSGFELDELSRRLKAGACELEDFALVREVQARERTRARSRTAIPAPA